MFAASLESKFYNSATHQQHKNDLNKSYLYYLHLYFNLKHKKSPTILASLQNFSKYFAHFRQSKAFQPQKSAHISLLRDIRLSLEAPNMCKK